MSVMKLGHGEGNGLRALALGAFLALVAGCSSSSSVTKEPASITGGVGVGNGVVIYQSPTYGYQLSYHKELKVEEVGQDLVRFDNTNFSAGGPVSVTTFQAMKNVSASTPDALRLYLTSQFAQHRFDPIKFPGAQGFYYEERSGDHLTGLYFILTDNHDLIRVDIDSYVSARGVEWVAPIVQSFSYTLPADPGIDPGSVQPGFGDDHTAPVVFSLRLEPRELIAGRSSKLYLQIQETESGVADFMNDCGFLVPLQQQGTGDQTYAIPVCGFLRPELGGWYSVEIQVPQFARTGQYVLESLPIADRAGNLRYLYLERGSRLYQGQAERLLPLVVQVR